MRSTWLLRRSLLRHHRGNAKPEGFKICRGRTKAFAGEQSSLGCHFSTTIRPKALNFCAGSLASIPSQLPKGTDMKRISRVILLVFTVLRFSLLTATGADVLTPCFL